MTPKRRAAISITPPSMSTLPLAMVANGEGWPCPPAYLNARRLRSSRKTA